MRHLVRILKKGTVPFFLAGAAALACGPFLNDLRTIETVLPAHMDRYAGGEVGVVRPHFARRYLVQAYRRFSAQPPLTNVAAPLNRGPAFVDPRTEMTRWQEARKFAGPAPRIDTTRRLASYQFFDNCLADAFVAATKTLASRVAQHGADSSRVREWVKAQDAVFDNCDGEGFVVPDPAPATAGGSERADREYQIASAYFYGMRYDEAARRFTAIAGDASSPWRTFGRYLAARAQIRKATVPETLQRDALTAAESELKQVLADKDAAALHASAKGLLDLISLRARPLEHLKTLSAALSSAPAVTDQHLTDFQRLMDRLLGDTSRYDYTAVENREAIANTADLNDWILVMQGEGAEAAARAVAQWRRTATVPWLAAAMWKVDGKHPDAGALLDAASRVPRDSPASPTLAFLRVRLLVGQQRLADARAALAATTPPAGDRETTNLLKAQQFMLATSMPELLAAAPRAVVTERTYSDAPEPPSREFDALPVFDDDAAVVFSEKLPLSRLVEAATSTALPNRLRLRVASAAFARAWLMKREADALKVAPVLRTLSPALAGDMQRYEAASSGADRHIAGLRLLLRTPGLRARVKGVEDNQETAQRQLARAFDHTFRRNWWCGFDKRELDDPQQESPLLHLLYPSGAVPFPSWLPKEEVGRVHDEWEAIAKLGPAPNYLAAEAVAWAKARPTDLDAAEALAHAVEGTRWGCTDERTTRASRSAFQTLHQLFPKTEWARKTKYWY